MAMAKKERRPPGEQKQMSLLLPGEKSPFHVAPRQPGFEALANENGAVFWWASDLARLLGYEDLRSFRKSVQKAMTVCMQLDVDIGDNILQVSRDTEGKTQEDFKLSRFACYLAAMNGDVKKPEVAQAQAYFVTYARACEVYVAQAEGVERIVIRGDIGDGEKGLALTAARAGVASFPFFQNAGYLGPYNMSISQLRSRKSLPGSRSPLDFMGKRELAANLFRIQETEERLRTRAVRGQAPAERTAEEVGREVRTVMTRDGGQAPENLPAAERHPHRAQGDQGDQPRLQKNRSGADCQAATAGHPAWQE